MAAPLNSKVYYKIRQKSPWTYITYWVDPKDIKQEKRRTNSLMPNFTQSIKTFLKRRFPYAQDYIDKTL